MHVHAEKKVSTLNSTLIYCENGCYHGRSRGKIQGITLVIVDCLITERGGVENAVGVDFKVQYFRPAQYNGEEGHGELEGFLRRSAKT